MNTSPVAGQAKELVADFMVNGVGQDECDRCDFDSAICPHLQEDLASRITVLLQSVQDAKNTASPVADHEKQVRELVEEYWNTEGWNSPEGAPVELTALVSRIAAFVESTAKAERERCAKIADEAQEQQAKKWHGIAAMVAGDIAAAIRAADQQDAGELNQP